MPPTIQLEMTFNELEGVRRVLQQAMSSLPEGGRWSENTMAGYEKIHAAVVRYICDLDEESEQCQ